MVEPTDNPIALDFHHSNQDQTLLHNVVDDWWSSKFDGNHFGVLWKKPYH